MSQAGSSNTAVTENDKIVAARRRDAEKNLKSTADDTENHTAAHALLPSDVEGFARQHDLTTQEAGEALHGRSVDEATKEVDNIKASRTVNRQVWIETPAGSSSPFEHNQRVNVVPPPDPSALDVHAPGPQDPTGYVIREDGDHRADEVRELGDEYVIQADEATGEVDEQVDEAGKEETTQVSTE